MSGTGDLQALLANFKSRASPATTNSGQLSQQSPQPSFDPNTFLQSQASPALASPAITAPSTSVAPHMASPNPSGGAVGGSDRTQSLLSLLKFSQPSDASSAQQQQQQPVPIAQSTSESHTMRQETAHGKAVKASDLISSFFSPSSTPGIRGGGNTLSNPLFPNNTVKDTNPSTAGNTAQESSQDALLKLLKRSASSSTEARQGPDATFSFDGSLNADFDSMKKQQPAKVAQTDSPARKASPIRMFGSSESREATPFEPPSTAATKENKPIFTYTNPFELLQASRNATPIPSVSPAGNPNLSGISNSPQENGDQRSMEATPQQKAMRRKLTPKGPLRSSSSIEPANGMESVAAKLDRIADQTSKEAGKALEEVQIKQEDQDTETEIDVMAHKLQETAINAAVEVKKELDKEENKDVLEESMSKPVAEAVKDLINDAAAEAAPPDGWETSDGPPEASPRDVPVYNFPLKPFVSITIVDLPPSEVGIREDGVMEISRFKKEFDQLDRTLASATSKYITYAFVKNGGMRVIRQDDGSDRHIFKHSGDRIFHVTLGTTAMTAPPTDQQAVLGVGLSGAVYYATISKEGNDLFENDSLDTESLLFPPYPAGNDNSSGGLLKTRVRRSSRHPEFFAIGRGKSIYIVWPATAISTKYGVDGSNRTVDVEKLYKDRPLKISTGKAGKDFIFSEDDTVIASLDKAGRLKFWDIRKLVDESNATAYRVQAEDVSVPILSFATASPAEKSWPTSVLFLDKVRPYVKGTALRYILVGLKQNHSLQLWDIGLGKVVQELNFPHNTETDGICSIAYHPNSGVVVVGHPTRNSVFFLHLSAPRYTLQPMSQATYLERIAIRDPELPKPEATAVMSGMREISFASKGHLRSIDLLPVHKPTDAPKDPVDSQTLFELYAVHSRGVTCLTIKKEDLGWGPDSKVLHPVDNAVETGLIHVDKLRNIGPVVEPDLNGAPETSQPFKASKKRPAKATSDPNPESTGANEKLEQFPPAPSATAEAGLPNGLNGGEGNTQSGAIASERDRKKKKKSGANTLLAPHSSKDPGLSKSPSPSLSPSKTSVPTTDLHNQIPIRRPNDTMASGQPSGPSQMPTGSDGSKEIVGVDIPGNWLDKEIEKLESSITTEFKQQLDRLYRRLDDDRHVQDAAGTTRQEAVLRLVSATLATNVENSLNRIIGQHMQQTVLPAISNVTASAIHNQVGEVLARALHGLIPQEIGTQLPVAISAAMQNPSHLRSLTDSLSKRLAPTMEAHFAELMHTTITPTFVKLAASAAEQAAGEIESRITAKLQQYEIDRQHDAAKIDTLQGSMQAMLEMMAHLSEGQIAFQDKILKDRSTLAPFGEAGSRPSSSAAAAFRSTPVPPRQNLSAQPSPLAPPPRRKTVEEMEMEDIAALMNEGNYEAGSVRWMQSNQAVELFDKLFVNYTPEYLRTQVSPLVAFSVGIAVANSFETNLKARLDWIYTSLDTIDTRVSAAFLLIHT